MEAERRTYIGGSDMAAILGLNPYKSPYHVWCLKRGLVTDDVGDQEAVYWGTRHEAMLMEEWARRTGGEVLAYPGPFLRHPTKPYLGGHTDGLGLADTLTLLEGKTVSERVFANQWEQPDGEVRAPSHYRIQGQWYLHLWHAKAAADPDTPAPPSVVHFPTLVGGNRFLVYADPYRPDLGAKLEAQADLFWERVVTGQVPDDFAPGDNLALAFPEERPGSQVDLSEDLLARWQDLDARIWAHEAELKPLREAKDKLALEVQAVMGDAERGAFPGGLVCTWNLKNGTRQGYTVEPKAERGFRWPTVRARKGA